MVKPKDMIKIKSKPRARIVSGYDKETEAMLIKKLSSCQPRFQQSKTMMPEHQNSHLGVIPSVKPNLSEKFNILNNNHRNVN